MEARRVPDSAARAHRRSGLVVPTVLLGTLAGSLAGCVGEPARSIRQSAEALIPSAAESEAVPAMLNETSPFFYPESAWDQRIQGNVTLRLHVGADGRAVRESTTVARTSGVPALDSAALAGASRLRFKAARRNGAPVGVSLLFPVHFRHPDGPPMPGDTLPTLP
jgi:TonB family protein